MRTIELRLPDPVFKQAQDLAAQENVPLDMLLSLAVTHAIGIWTTERQISTDVKSTSRKRFLDMIQNALESEQSTIPRFPGAG